MKTTTLSMTILLLALSSAPAMAQTPDIYEEDDTCPLRLPAIHGADLQERNFQDDADDWVPFNACAGRYYEIETFIVGTHADTILELYDRDCITLIDSDDNGGTGLGSFIAWTAPVNGTYHLRIRQANSTIGADREYDLSLIGNSSTCDTWSANVGRAGEMTYAMEPTPDGGLIVAGGQGFSDTEGWIYRLDADGGLLWDRTYGQSFFLDIARMPDGDYVAASITADDDPWIMRIDADGNPIWSTLLAYTAPLDVHLAPVSDGGIILATTWADDADNEKLLIAKLSADGSVLWHREYESSFYSTIWAYPRAKDLIPTADGNFALAMSWVETDGTDLLLFDGAGNILWSKSYEGTPGDGAVYGLTQAGDGGFALAGTASGYALLIKTDASGDAAWATTCGTSDEEFFNDVIEAGNGRFLALGGYGAYWDDYDCDIWLVEVDQSGNLTRRWYYAGDTLQFGRQLHEMPDGGLALAIDSGYAIGEPGYTRVMRIEEDGGMDAACPTLLTQTYSEGIESVTASDLTLTESFPTVAASSNAITAVAGSSAVWYHCATIDCPDADSDGRGSPSYPGCDPGPEEDCNDGNPLSYEGATELCDGWDNNCNSLLDEGCDRSCDAPSRWGSEIRITQDAALSESISMAWNGNGYGIAWCDDRDGNKEIYFAALDSSGTQVGSDVRVTNDGGTSAIPSLVWTGTEYGLAWRETSSGDNELHFMKLDSTGSAASAEERITYSSGSSYSPRLVWTGSEFGVAWMDQRTGDWELYFARIDASGNKSGSDIRLTNRTGNSWAASLAWNGNGYGIAWQEAGDGVLEIYFKRLDPLGNEIGSELRLTNDPADSHAPRMVWTGSEYGLTWYDGQDGNNEIYFARIHEGGYQIGSNIRVTHHSSITSEPNIAWSGNEYGLSWLDNRYGNFEIAFARLDSVGNKIGANVRISEATGWSEWPKTVWNGAHYAIAWQDERHGNKEVYFASVKCCGNDVDGDFQDACVDCNDNDAAVYPGATEICDRKDNNCDTVIDEGFPTPGLSSGLSIGSDKQTFIWDGEPVADRYDVVKGDLMALRSSNGNFNSSLLECLENDSGDTSTPDGLSPGPGAGWYYLVRAVADCKEGSYDNGQPSQVGLRDDEIDASGNSCP